MISICRRERDCRGHGAMYRKGWTYQQKSEVSTVTGSATLSWWVSTMSSKIIRALVIIRVKNLIPNEFLRDKYLSSQELQVLYCLQLPCDYKN